MAMTLYRYLRMRGLKTTLPDDMRILKSITIEAESGPVKDRELVYKVRLSRAALDALQAEHPELSFKRPGYAGRGV